MLVCLILLLFLLQQLLLVWALLGQQLLVLVAMRLVAGQVRQAFHLLNYLSFGG